MVKNKGENKPTSKSTIGSAILIALFIYIIAVPANMTGINPLSAFGYAILLIIAIELARIVEDWVDNYILWGSIGELFIIAITLVLVSLIADTYVTMALGMKILLILIAYFSARLQSLVLSAFGR